jgi:hypothetical protein
MGDFMNNEATSQPRERREYSKSFLMWVAAALLAAALFGGSAVVYAALHQKEQAEALSAKEQYDEAFLLAMKNRLEEQAVAIAAVQDSLSRIVPLTAGPPPSGDIRDIIDGLEALQRSNRQTDQILRDWHDTSVALNPQRVTLNISPIGTAYAADKKQQNKAEKQPTQPQTNAATPNASLVQPPPQTEQHESKFRQLRPFLWAFIIVPLFFGYRAFGHVNSQNARTQDFAFGTIAAVLGYYFGIGAGAFAVAFA